MPATAGRVRMPANNRMQTSSSLNTHGIWQNAIGYDPYAAEKADSGGAGAAASDEAGQNAYENMKGLLALARQTQGAVRGGEEDGRGGWKGEGKLRGGWAAGKDLGHLPKEAAVDADAMPSSTSSETDDDDDDDERLAGGYYGHPAPSAGASTKRPTPGIDKKKSKRHKEKKEKKHKKHKKKEKKEKRDKKDKSHKRSRHKE